MVISIFCAQIKTNFTHRLFPTSEIQKQPLKHMPKGFHYSMLLFPLDDMYFSHVFSTIDIRCHIRVL